MIAVISNTDGFKNPVKKSKTKIKQRPEDEAGPFATY